MRFWAGGGVPSRNDRVNVSQHFTKVLEVLGHRSEPVFRQAEKRSSPVQRVIDSFDQPLLPQDVDPPQGCCRWNTCGQPDIRYGNSPPFLLCDEELEENIPGRIRQQRRLEEPRA